MIIVLIGIYFMPHISLSLSFTPYVKCRDLSSSTYIFLSLARFRFTDDEEKKMYQRSETIYAHTDRIVDDEFVSRRPIDIVRLYSVH